MMFLIYWIDNMFEDDLNQSRKGVSFIRGFFSLLGREMIEHLEAPKKGEHPPDLIETLDDGYQAFYEVKEDARSIQTGNIFFEERALHRFSLYAKENKAFALLIIVPYKEPKPLIFYVSNDLREALESLRLQSIARYCSVAGDNSAGWIVPISHARSLGLNIVNRFLSNEEIMIFESLFKSAILTEENHLFMRWS